MDLLGIGLGVVDWIGLAQDRYRWRVLVNAVMNLRVPEWLRNLWPPKWYSAQHSLLVFTACKSKVKLSP
jgi:hypothetical protein